MGRAGGRDGVFRELAQRERETARSGARSTSAPIRLRQRASALRHSLHVMPGETVLELGAGSGDFTQALAAALGPRNPITAVVFDDALAKQANERNLAHVAVWFAEDLLVPPPSVAFDYIVGRAMLSHEKWPEVIELVTQLLKPGGRMLFFEDAGGKAGNFRRSLLAGLSSAGYSEVSEAPYDIVPARTPRRIREALPESISVVLEQAPGVRSLCGSRCVTARKASEKHERVPAESLATDPALFGSTSVVVPCHNEEANVESLYRAMTACYDEYIDEFVFVDDCSEDHTAKVIIGLSELDDRVKLVQRVAPPGVGRALRDGYAEAEGRLILSMDCDAHAIVPEIRDMFAAVAAGADGAIGSRFSNDTVLVNYPFLKLLANRSFHLVAAMMTRRSVHDVSNNLKLYRASILKELRISRHDFAANAETGLRPIMAGYDIREVPISWIGRSEDMGTSSFKLAPLASSYFKALLQMLRDHRTHGGRR